MKSDLLPGHQLLPGNTMTSPTGAFQLTFRQTDGNIVLQALDDTDYPHVVQYKEVVYSFDTHDRAAQRLVMQTDGNLVVYNPHGSIWASGTQNNPGALLRLQDDGNLVIYLANGVVIWQSGAATGEAQ